MTVDNSIKLLKKYKQQSIDPVNAENIPIREPDERKAIMAQSKKNYEMMKKHILSSRKYKGHEIIEELLNEDKKEKAPVEEIKEEKQDGKKSKR